MWNDILWWFAFPLSVELHRWSVRSGVFLCQTQPPKLLGDDALDALCVLDFQTRRRLQMVAIRTKMCLLSLTVDLLLSRHGSPLPRGRC